MSQSPQTASERGSPGAKTPERLGIAGSGTIACGLAAAAASRGLDVMVWARSRESAKRARNALRRDCERLDNASAAEQVRLVPELAGLAGATLVVEAVAEQRSVKQAVLGALGESLAADALIATTTSSLSVADLGAACGRPERFFGLHVFNPVARMKLVEVCFPSGAGATRSRALAFCEAIDKVPIEVPDETGFVVNRLLFPFLFDAVRLLERTGLEPDQIDACMKLGASHPMGPLELLDLVGIDVAEAIGEALHAETGDPAHRPPGRIKELVGEGRLGRKSAGGFYRYD